jgi:hypothetical protein
MRTVFLLRKTEHAHLHFQTRNFKRALGTLASVIMRGISLASSAAISANILKSRALKSAPAAARVKPFRETCSTPNTVFSFAPIIGVDMSF